MTYWKKLLRIPAMALLAFLPAVSVFAADVTVNLVAEQVDVTMADGAVVPMWGLRDASATPGTATVPGPTISAAAGDNLIINLTNNLSEPTSLVINGQKATETGAMIPTWTDNSTGNRTSLNQRVRSFTHETATGGATATYRWGGLKPGTYLLESGSHQAVQIPMGLYAALKVDVAAGQAYPSINYTADVVLLFSEVDPALNAAVASGEYGSAPESGLYTTSMGMGYLPRYFLINGQSFRRFSEGGRIPLPAGSANGTTLVRFLNAGSRTRNPVLQGPYMTLVAEDGNPLPFPLQQYSVYLPAAKTMDAIFQPTAVGSFPLYDRSLGLTNGTTSPGGMLTYLQIAPSSGGQVTAPNGGEVLISGDIFTVQWNSGLGAVRYNLWYSLDNGATWNFVAAVGAVNSYEWTVPAVNSTTSLFRVVGFDAGDAKVSSDKSNAPFTIAPRTSALLVTPNGGETLTSGDIYTVQWKSPTNDTIGYHNLLYSLDNGGTWNWIRSVGPNVRNFDWMVPAVAASAPISLFRVDVFNSGGTQIGSDVSDGNFTVSPRTNVLLTAPNGGETLTSGNNFTVQWKAPTANPVGYYGLWYSLDSGATWAWIGTAGGQRTDYNWMVPVVGGSTPTNLFRVRAFSSGGAPLSTDVSDGSFTIQP